MLKVPNDVDTTATTSFNKVGSFFKNFVYASYLKNHLDICEFVTLIVILRNKELALLLHGDIVGVYCSNCILTLIRLGFLRVVFSGGGSV